MSDSVRPHRRQPTRLPYPWNSPSKNTGVGCHFLLQCMKVKSESEVAQSCSKWKVKVKSLSCVRLFATPWTVAYQAPPFMGFSRQEYWSGVPLPFLLFEWATGKQIPAEEDVALIFMFLKISLFLIIWKGRKCIAWFWPNFIEFKVIFQRRFHHSPLIFQNGNNLFLIWYLKH